MYRLVFQSTSSAWRTTVTDSRKLNSMAISIHVLRMEDDISLSFIFYLILIFQSTSSAWRTTMDYYKESFLYYISIHVLRMEDDTVVGK